MDCISTFLQQIFALTQPHGSGELLFSWQPGSGIYLATAGSDQSVAIHNRNGKLVERIRLRGSVFHTYNSP